MEMYSLCEDRPKLLKAVFRDNVDAVLEIGAPRVTRVFDQTACE